MDRIDYITKKVNAVRLVHLSACRAGIAEDDGQRAVVDLHAQNVGTDVVQTVIDIYDIVVVDDCRRVVVDIALFGGRSSGPSSDESEQQHSGQRSS